MLNSGAAVGHTTADAAARTIIGEIAGCRINGAPKLIFDYTLAATRMFVANDLPINAIRVNAPAVNLTGGDVYVYTR